MLSLRSQRILAPRSSSVCVNGVGYVLSPALMHFIFDISNDSFRIKSGCGYQSHPDKHRRLTGKLQVGCPYVPQLESSSPLSVCLYGDQLTRDLLRLMMTLGLTGTRLLALSTRQSLLQETFLALMFSVQRIVHHLCYRLLWTQ